MEESEYQQQQQPTKKKPMHRIQITSNQIERENMWRFDSDTHYLTHRKYWFSVR